MKRLKGPHTVEQAAPLFSPLFEHVWRQAAVLLRVVKGWVRGYYPRNSSSGMGSTSPLDSAYEFVQLLQQRNGFCGHVRALHLNLQDAV